MNVTVEQAALIRAAYAGQLFPDVQVDLFRHTDRVFPTRTIHRGSRKRPLTAVDSAIRSLSGRSRGTVYDLYDYVSRNRVASLVILKRGQVVFEQHALGNEAGSRWLSMSMAKSISTTLVGAALQDGHLESVEEPLVRYLPELQGGAYDGVTIRQLLQMTSGVRWNDTSTDLGSERHRMLELQIAQRPGAILQFLAAQPRVAAPGTVWNYSTGETHVVGALLRAAVGRWPADYLSDRIWQPFGMEADAYWWLESPGGLEVAGSGISATVRDYARFGQFVLEDGIVDGRRVVPEGWFREATSPRLVDGRPVDYGYMWWPVPDADGTHASRAFSARGIFGQYLYVNPAEEVIVAVGSARSKPLGAEAILDNDFFAAVVRVLR